MVKMKKTTAMKIAEEISTRIARGILHPGERLIETSLAEEFQTSRGPIREALLMLERDRMVKRVPHQGVVVRNYSRKEFLELYDVIYRLEEIAFAKAISQVTDADITKLEETIALQQQACERRDVEAYYELNEQFHELIFTIAGNTVLLQMYQSLRRPARPFRLLTMAQGDNLTSSLSEHTAQVAALRQRDIESGKQAIREQETRSLRSLELLFPV